jgi:hypothetical protein
LRARLRYARLRHQAAVEDVDYRAARGLDALQSRQAQPWRSIALAGTITGVNTAALRRSRLPMSSLIVPAFRICHLKTRAGS